MTRSRSTRRLASFAAALVVTGLALLAPMPASAQEYKIGPLKISAPWSRATPGGAKVAGGFMVIENTGKSSDFLVGGSFVRSGRIEIHEMAVVGDIMRMRELPQGLEIKPGAKVTLKPGGYHVMFMELKQPLKEGELVEGTLVFKSAGTVKVSYRVGAMGKKPGSHHGKH